MTEELEHLCARAIEGSATSEELARLQILMQQDPQVSQTVHDLRLLSRFMRQFGRATSLITASASGAPDAKLHELAREIVRLKRRSVPSAFTAPESPQQDVLRAPRSSARTSADTQPGLGDILRLLMARLAWPQ